MEARALTCCALCVKNNMQCNHLEHTQPFARTPLYKIACSQLHGLQLAADNPSLIQYNVAKRIARLATPTFDPDVPNEWTVENSDAFTNLSVGIAATHLPDADVRALTDWLERTDAYAPLFQQLHAAGMCDAPIADACDMCAAPIGFRRHFRCADADCEAVMHASCLGLVDFAAPLFPPPLPQLAEPPLLHCFCTDHDDGHPDPQFAPVVTDPPCNQCAMHVAAELRLRCEVCAGATHHACACLRINHVPSQAVKARFRYTCSHACRVAHDANARALHATVVDVGQRMSNAIRVMCAAQRAARAVQRARAGGDPDN